jgi:hypothetical protein
MQNFFEKFVPPVRSNEYKEGWFLERKKRSNNLIGLFWKSLQNKTNKVNSENKVISIVKKPKIISEKLWNKLLNNLLVVNFSNKIRVISRMKLINDRDKKIEEIKRVKKIILKK